MIHSMTGFAREELSLEWGSIAWEVKSVNFRYLDVSTRLPEDLRVLEPRVRERVGAKLARGKVECALRYHPAPERAADFAINMELVKKLAAASNELSSLLANHQPLHPIDVLRWPGVMEPKALDLEAVSATVMTLFDQVLKGLIEGRRREGEKMYAMIDSRCEEVDRVTAGVREQLPAVTQAARERLQARLAELRSEVNVERLEQEMVIFAAKVDVAEELDRLGAHTEEVRRVLRTEQPAGRRLDFLMQEMNREANTLGSKSADAETTRAAVDLKVLIEQMREQIQNIE